MRDVDIFGYYRNERPRMTTDMMMDVIFDSDQGEWTYGHVRSAWEPPVAVFAHRYGFKVHVFVRSGSLVATLNTDAMRARADPWVAGKMLSMFPFTLISLIRVQAFYDDPF